MPENGEGKTTRIGGYEILGRLGQGGMGAVYKARQVSMDRVVALKVLPPRLAKDEVFVQRFIREAQSAATLQHPNIVQGIDVGVADGYYYFAMELVDGPTVKQLVAKEGALDEKRALGIARSVAVALAHAHEHGIIHRDIKPSNILLTPKGEPKLADLGLARRVEEAGSVTLEGTALGTPYCMAPEQVRGLPDVDIRADIYALGATLHYLLTGAFPYDGPTASAIMMKHVTEPVPSAHEAHPNVSRACSDLIARMMAKAPNDRPQTPTDLLSDIDDALAGKVTLRPGPRSKTRTLASRPQRPKPHSGPTNVGGVSVPRVLPKKKAGPWLAAGACLLLLATIIVIWLATRGGGPPKPPPTDPAQLALQQADAYAKQHPADYDGAIARYQAVAKQHTGSQWAAIAAGRVDELRKRKVGATAVTKASKELEAAIAKLKADARALASNDRFGDALKAIADFAAAHNERAAADAADKLKAEVLAKGGERFDALADAADDAKGAGDYAKARATLQPVLAFGIPDLVDAAKRKLASYDAEEKNAEHLAKWEGVKAQAAKLAEEGKFDDALKLLEAAKAIPLDDVADRVADEAAAVEDARRDALDKVLAAYAAESEIVWAAFKDRDYAAADRLLAELAKRPEFAVGGMSTPRETDPAAWRHAAHSMLAADEQAAALLKAFWTAAEEGLKLRVGQFLAFGGEGGTIAAVKDGQVTLKTPKGEATLPIAKLGTKQALSYALLKSDARSKLIEAVFLLAAAADPAAAAQALAAAGDAPGLAHYRDRLDALRLGAAELAARRAWEGIQRSAKGELTGSMARRVLDMLADFAERHSRTKFYATLGVPLASLRARVEKALEPVVPRNWPFAAAEAKRRQIAAARRLGVKVEERSELGNGVKLTMVLIPAGEFLMGSPGKPSLAELVRLYDGKEWRYQSELPQHRVRIASAFWLGKYEVTQEQWQVVMGVRPSKLLGAENPVEQVSWGDCQAFLTRLNRESKGRKFRLATEAEWEYACRSGSPTQFHFGDAGEPLQHYAWLHDNAGRTSHPVGQKKPNAWGLYDMHGNVWEWCGDWYGGYAAGAQRDPTGPDTGENRVLRGGSWVYPLRMCRSAYRYWQPPGHRSHDVGFRVARPVGPEAEGRGETAKEGE